MMFEQWKPDSVWDDHPYFTPADWAIEVQNNDTRLGYVDWVNSCLSLDTIAKSPGWE